MISIRISRITDMPAVPSRSSFLFLKPVVGYKITPPVDSGKFSHTLPDPALSNSGDLLKENLKGQQQDIFMSGKGIQHEYLCR